MIDQVRERFFGEIPSWHERGAGKFEGIALRYRSNCCTLVLRNPERMCGKETDQKKLDGILVAALALLMRERAREREREDDVITHMPI